MTAHELARKLLEGPDLPVTLPVGYHSSGEYLKEADDVFEMDKLADKNSDNYWPERHVHIIYKD